jgi:carbon-monoxide dehydrogenase medium subunit
MRCETSVKRALVARRLAPEWLAALIAFGAHVVLGEEQRVSLEDLSGRREDGVIRALLLPLGALRCGMARVARTEADAPIVSAVAVVRLQGQVVQEARVALTGVSPEAVCVVRLAEALGGEALDEEGLSDATALVAAAVDPQGDYLGSVEYRRAMAEVLARRALAACLVGYGG